MYLTSYPSPIGHLTLSSDGRALTGIWVDGQRHYGWSLPQENRHERDLEIFDQAIKWLDRYFAGQDPDPMEVPLALGGTAFREAVWAILLQIPYGQTVTYQDIALQLARASGRNSSARAVGGAVGHNPVSILVPCHRVIGSDGSLTGFASGLHTKIWLLEHEGYSCQGRL